MGFIRRKRRARNLGSISRSARADRIPPRIGQAASANRWSFSEQALFVGIAAGNSIDGYTVQQRYSVGRRRYALAFLHYNKSLQQISLGDAWVVVDGRVQGADQEELGFRDGSPIKKTLKRLRETYERSSRYRRYDDIAPTAALETLRHKTGWLAIGALAADRDVWTDGQRDLRPDERPFEVVADGQPARNVPRAKDRIRLKEGGSIIILDFGSRGEALRNLSPTSRPRGGHVTDLTGTRVDADAIYTVADVRLELGGDIRLVWVRLVAIR